jgi:hypothetical protein
MHPELENLLTIALKDGILTDREKEILLNKAKKLNVDLDEFKMELEGYISTIKNQGNRVGKNQSGIESVKKDPLPIKKKGFFSFLHKSYTLEDAYLKGLKKLNKFGVELNPEVQPKELKKYLHEGMSDKEIEIAVLDAFNEVFGKFTLTQAYKSAIDLLKKKQFVNPNRQESELKKHLKEGMMFEEIDSAVEDAYQKYFSRYGKEDALKLAIAYIKGLGPIDSSLDFVQNNVNKVIKNENLLMSYFTDNMGIEEIEIACKTAYMNQFGKKSWGGLGSREMTNPDFTITDIFTEEK